MNDERYVAAIEISSSKIMAAVGQMLEGGRLNVIATQQERGVESVRYGKIENPEETAMRVNRLLAKLQHDPAVAPREITGVYVGLSGRSLRNIKTEVGLNLPDETEINDDILLRLREQALATAIDSSLEVIDAIPRMYTVGKLETRSPKGAIGNKIEAVFDLIVCRPDLRRNLHRTLTDKLGLRINGFVVTALAAAQVILTSEEKRLGCMLVDMGAETTTVSIYKGGALRYFATLPLGGRNITRDIATTNSLLEERSEEIKVTSGNAMPRETPSTLNVYGIKMSVVSNLIVARSEEIVANIVEQMKYAGLKDSELPGGLICIGGGMNLNGMIDLLAKRTDLPVRRGQLPGYITLEASRLLPSEVLQVASIMYCGASESQEECLEIPRGDELPVTGEGYDDDQRDREIEENKKQKKNNRSGLFSRLGVRISEIFGNPGEDDSDLIE